MSKQDLDYPECPYCGTRVRMISEIENMKNLDEIAVLCHHCGMLYSIEAFFTYDCHKIEGLK